MLLIAVLAGLCWLDARSGTPLVWLLPVAVLLSLAASSELVHLLAKADLRPLAGVVIAGSALIVASSGVPILWRSWHSEASADPATTLAWPLLALVVCVLAAFVGEMRRYENPGRVTINLAACVFSLVYIGVLMSFLVQLRGVPRDGMTLLLALIVVAKLADIGAYSVGRLLGKHKLAPRISPGKTIEGAAGAMLFGALGAYLVLGLYLDHVWWRWLLFGLIISLAGMLGDLAESLLKRDLKQKDSSDWVPGFGGVLDILDSPLFAAPVAYLCWWTGLVGNFPPMSGLT